MTRNEPIDPITISKCIVTRITKKYVTRECLACNLQLAMS